ncbi:MAG TPA: 5-methylcytosine-specific restriction endonuclease system specificity protein McrC [Saprospiraceae bacterium]|nr:5-methylcytosine-specific restriction endonuclease system specificity protein McrC [Saprospiraceae bacterium]
MSIPIQNIYYLLCYAWNKLDERDRVAVSADGCTELVDLFAKVLIQASKILLKRGIDRNYVPYEASIPGIKGKLALSETIKTNSLLRQRTVCQFDEFSPDIPTNQILLTTLYQLYRVKALDEGLKTGIRRLLPMFPDVQPIALKSSTFRQLRLHRNNHFYDFILKVCELIHENLLPDERPGYFRFADFRRDDQQMAKLYEEFLFQFYRKEQQLFAVSREQIRWKFDAPKLEDLNYLPSMYTDITLRNKTEKIIIDAKYYRQALTSRFEVDKLISSNLYQIFSYLLNQERESDPASLTARGVLLYPLTGPPLDLSFRYGRHEIQVKTVDLNAHWREIEGRLLGVVKIHQTLDLSKQMS